MNQSTVIRVYLSEEMKKQVRLLADKKNITMSSMVKVIIFDYLYMQGHKVKPDPEKKESVVKVDVAEPVAEQTDRELPSRLLTPSPDGFKVGHD